MRPKLADPVLAYRESGTANVGELATAFPAAWIGRAEGRAELVLELLARRFGPLTCDIQARVHAADSSQLASVVETILTAPTLETAIEALA